MKVLKSVRRNLVALFATIALVFPGSGSSQTTAGDPCFWCTTTVFFTNGVFNTPYDAVASTNALRDQVGLSIGGAAYAYVQFGTAYNPMNAWGGDVVEAFRQTVQVQTVQATNWLANLPLVPDAVRQALLRATSDYTKFNVSFQDISDHIAAYKQNIAAGRRVIVVAHSQGNFFANQIYSYLTPQEQQSFAILSVANPTEPVAGGSRFLPNPTYVTSLDDLVIKPLASTGLALPANTVNGFNPNDWSGHTFVTSYLGLTSTSRGNISSVIAYLFGAVPQPGVANSQIDNFNDNSINASLWTSVIAPPGVGTIAETNQRLEMLRLIAGGPAYQGLQGRCSIGGDFDVQVDFTLLNWPVLNFNTLRFMAQDLPQGPLGHVGISRNSYGGENYQMRAGTGVVGEVLRSDSSGKLRLIRTGSLIQGYYWSVISGFVPLGPLSTTTTNATRFVIDFSSPSGTPQVAPQGVHVAIDNFVVNQGTVVCPPTPAGPDLPAGYIVHGGLVWMPTGPVDYTWGDANALCANSINGQSGWRLPSLAELSSLYASDLMRNQGWSLFWTWSSTFVGTIAGGDTYSIVNLSDGRVNVNFASGGANRDRVTCVRQLS